MIIKKLLVAISLFFNCQFIYSQTNINTLFSTETPTSSYNDSRYELGTEFLTLSKGFITRARLYSHINEGGNHNIRLWILNGSSYSLAAGPFTWNFSTGIQGWREYTFATPIAVDSNNTYIISISKGPDRFYERTLNFQSSTVGTYIKYMRGTYTEDMGQAPTTSYSNSCYFRDVVFSTTNSNDNLTAGTIDASQTVCYNTAPLPFTELIAPSGGTGSYNYQWQSSTDNLNWSNIPGATQTGYLSQALTTNTYFRRTVTSDSYSPVYSASILVTVSPQVTHAQLSDNKSIENNSSTNITVSILGGASPYTINYTRNGVAHQSIYNYSSGADISTGILSKGLYTYSLTSVSDANGCQALSLGYGSSINVAVNGNLTAGSIGSAQTICYNTAPAALTQLAAPSGGTGEYNYQWQNSNDNLNWSNISGATLTGYSPQALSVNTYFRRSVTSGSYTPVYSTSILITVSPQITLAQLSDNKSIENNSSTNINVLISGGISPFTINYTRNGVAQQTIYNYSSGADIPTGVLSTGLYTYSLSSVSDLNECQALSLGYSTSINVAVNGNLAAGTIGASQMACFNKAPLPFTELIAPSGGTGSYDFQWQKSTDNLNWSNIPGATQAGYTSNELSASTYFRRSVTSGSYTPVYSASILVTVSPQVTLAQLSDNKSLESNTLSNINVVISGGAPPYTINYTCNGVAQTTINNYYSGADISTGILTTGIYTYILSSVTDGNGCNTMSLGQSSSIDVTVNGDLTAGAIGSPQTVCYNTAPIPFTQHIAPSGGNGIYNYQWQSSTDNINWANIPGANQSGYAPIKLTVSNYFRRSVISGSYSPVYCASILVTVSPQVTLTQLSDSKPLESNTSTTINVVISGGFPPYNINYTRNGVEQSTINNYSSGADISTGVLKTGLYTYVLTSVTDANVCNAMNLGHSSSIDVTVNGNLTAGTIGSSQTVCYNTSPLPFTELIAPSGGTRSYNYQWQSSTDNNNWNNIPGAIQAGYTPLELSVSTYFRRSVTSGNYTPVQSASILVTVSPPITLAQLSDNKPLESNTSTTINVVISGGFPPYNINYTRNGVAQSTINNYSSGADISTGVLTTGLYTYVLTSVTDANRCNAMNLGHSSSIDVTVNGNLTAGTIGNSQTIGYNTIPAILTQLTTPSGGTGVYAYRWQNSTDNVNWTSIRGTTLSYYEPPALTTSTYYRLRVTSGNYTSVYSSSVLINVIPPPTAQLHYNVTIYNNTTTNISVEISEGIPPYTVSYMRNGVRQATLNNYTSFADISTGVLNTGVYTYELTSVTDANGNDALDLGTSIAVTVTNNQSEIINSNKALIIVNSSSSYYQDYINYIKPYIDNFGIPYDVCNINTNELPVFSEYAIIIFGHKNVYTTGYPIARLEASISGGVGLYSFDSHLFDFASGFNTLISSLSVNSSQITISNSNHYITQNHAPDSYSPSNNVINLLSNWTVVQKSNLANGTTLANLGSSGQSVPLLQVSTFGDGKIVKWSGYDWVFENILGPVFGMDDLIWRGIVWAARKPFVMQGLPPMITMRVDDVIGEGRNVMDNFEWVKICNEFGIIPWCGTFNDWIPTLNIPTLKSLIDNNKATASPHAFGDQFIYFNHDGITPYDAAANVRKAGDFYKQNGLKISKYFVPHFYEINSAALSEIKALGGEFLATHMLPDNFYRFETPWLNCGPYRINRNGPASNEKWPVHYGGFVNLNGIEFFICLTEIRDDGTYEWYPTNDVFTTSARGIRHLRRSLNSMVLSSLFTHEHFFASITTSNMREIVRQITSSIAEYNPEYTSTDYAARYIRAKSKIKITSVYETPTNIEISYVGNNDLATKCYLFTEQNGQITYRFVGLPQINGSNKLSISK